MIAGHFGFAAIVKSREPRVPLWSLMLACVWLDILFVPLFLAGIETLRPAPGLAGGYGQNIIHADYTHSLLGALLISAAYGFMFSPRWGKRCAVVLAFVCFSHWLLDLIVHRHDMPVFPANAYNLPRLGFGLWRLPTGSILSELILIVAGAVLYWRAADKVTAEVNRGRTRAMVTTALILFCGLLVLALDVRG